MEKLARSLGIEDISRSQVSGMTKGLNIHMEFGGFQGGGIAAIHLQPTGGGADHAD